jgi:hypothetical protein
MREEAEARAKGHLPTGGMHPPRWYPQHRLMDWPDCNLDLQCSCGAGTTTYPCKLLASRHGNRTFADVLPRLRCKRCGQAPREIYLVAGFQREIAPGPDPDWSLPLRLFS